MKKLISFLLVLIFAFSGCQKEEPPEPPKTVGNCSFTMYDIYPEEGNVFSGTPCIFGNKIVFCTAHYIGTVPQGTGNIYVYDIDSGKENTYDDFVDNAFLCGDYLYYSDYDSGEGKCKLVKVNMQNGTKDILFTAPDDRILGISNVGSGNYFIFWTSDKNYYNAEYFFYDTEKETYTAFPEGMILDPYHNFKIRNNFTAFAQKSEGGQYSLYVLNLQNNKTEIIHKAKKRPIQCVYNGDVLIWNDDDGVHYLKDGAAFDLDEKYGNNGGDIDLYGNRYIFFFYHFQIYIYDIETNQIVFSTKEKSEKDPHHPSYYEWFSLDEESGKACFTLWDRDLALSLYKDWPYEEYPELISIIDIKELE